MTWKERFFRFLKEEGVYSEWLYNIYEQHPIWDKTFWECKLKEILSEDKKCYKGISSAFCWSYTRQGCYFWSNLNNKWKDKCGYWKQLL